ncbi:MAG: Fe-S cluster domain-containing protein [Nanoarchaeota archaeon]|nr:Fe-S cluster domain-containing protein [Nanoarchaeota archaeon]
MITESIIVLGSLGLGFGVFLAYASKKFEVKSDPRVNDVLRVLPGVNCGACGYAGCSAYAEAVALNKDVPVTLCIPGQKEVAEKIAKIVGREASEKKVELVAQLKCNGGKEEAKTKYEYDGIRSCKAASLVSGGPKACSYGCMGYGDCVNVCKFDALHMDDNGLPVVDKEKCVACGACVKECPKRLFKFVPKEKKIHVLCNSKDAAKVVTQVCKVGCIACKLCENACPADAIHVKDNLAEITYSKCTMCGKCVSACPRKIIVDEREK